MLRFEHVSKRYPDGTVAVDDLDLDVAEGELVTLVGPSGCGKTTTMKMVNRLEEPTEGRVLLDGQDVASYDPVKLRRRIGYVIQQVGLFPHRTVLDNTATVPLLLGRRRADARRRAAELLELVGLDPSVYGSRYPDQLSGGQRQRVGVARARAAAPPVLLMDEPFGAVDPVTRERLQDEFLDLQAKIRKTIVLVTHDVTEAVKLGDRIALFGEQARIAQYDTPAAILAAPADDFVASFIGSGAAIRGLRLVPVGTLPLDPVDVVTEDPARDDPAREDMAREDPAGAGAEDAGGAPRAVLVGADGRPRRWLRPPARPDAGTDPAAALVREAPSPYDALGAMPPRWRRTGCAAGAAAGPCRWTGTTACTAGSRCRSPATAAGAARTRGTGGSPTARGGWRRGCRWARR
ncbi:ABC transporter ATP-binding protein [Streptomyces specialis]|uniref:ABC transporter ATP-binding protein n=1 Tax=Streptomyces specialis TaxID=498367 RepID=UPI001F4340B3|nr:ATP-binding cassette domain-containing protein [Streptomyces specialis]